MKCPNCGFEEIPAGSLECPGCSVIFAKWQAKRERESADRDVPAEAPAASSSPASLLFRFAKYAAMIVATGALYICCTSAVTLLLFEYHRKDRRPKPPEFKTNRSVRIQGDLSLIEKHIVWYEGQEEALAEAKRLLHAMLDEADPKIVHCLATNKMRIVIVPKNKKLTDLAHFASIRGRKTGDNRSWDDLRGVAGHPLADGGTATGVAEEGLISRPEHATHLPRFIFIHEIAHDVQSCLSDEMLKESNRLYWSSMGMGNYGNSSPNEYFAQASAYYFGYANPGILHEKMEDGVKLDLKLSDFMRRVYGPPRKI